MSLIPSLLAETVEGAEHHVDPIISLTAAGIAFAVFLLLGVVTWSYRDVYHRHAPKSGAGHDDHH